jgi:cation diffusion facilitator family transporter
MKSAPEIPPEKEPALRRAIRLEWLTIVFLITAVSLVYYALGSSQAMKAAWLEDCLSFLPPIAFLVSNRVRRRQPSSQYPFGYFRSVSIAYLVAALALLIMGVYLIGESALELIGGERTPIGLVTVFGFQFWAGWLMIGALGYTLVPPILLGRAKMKPASELHDKVLYADADMNKADWMTAAAGIVGVLGIGIGWWWLDAAAAIVIGTSITRDGWKNLRTGLGDLMDSRASRYNNRRVVHPAVEGIRTAVLAQPDVSDVQIRVREQGHIFHAEYSSCRHNRMPSRWQRSRGYGTPFSRWTGSCTMWSSLRSGNSPWAICSPARFSQGIRRKHRRLNEEPGPRRW